MPFSECKMGTVFNAQPKHSADRNYSGDRLYHRGRRFNPHSAVPGLFGDLEQHVLALRKKLPTFGAARLRREFDLPLSHMAMQRIWREHGLLKSRKKKYQRKQDLARIKARWALFQQTRNMPRPHLDGRSS
jgi:hypothetical protein